MSICSSLLLAAISASVCAGSVDAPENSSTGSSVSKVRAVTNEYTDSLLTTKALQLLYGNDAEIQVDKTSGQISAIWKPTPEINDQLFPDGETGPEVRSIVNLVLPIGISGVKRYLILTASSPYFPDKKEPLYDCHGCSAALGGAVITVDQGTWKATVKSLHIDNFGAWGSIPSGQMILIGPSAFGVRFDLDYTDQGDTNSSMVIVGQVGNELKTILDIPTAASDTEGSCADTAEEAKGQGKKFNPKLWCYEYVSDYRFIMHPGSDIYDLVVNYAGTDDDENSQVPEGMKIVDVTRTDTYSWDGAKYILASSKKGATQFTRDVTSN
jgi:hypothetical protein